MFCVKQMWEEDLAESDLTTLKSDVIETLIYSLIMYSYI